MNYRSPKLLIAVREIPCTWPKPHLCCRNVEAAHSNQIRDAKGKGIKAHDYRIAAICHTAHMELDQGHHLSKDERREAWEEAHRRTVGELFERRLIKVA